MLKRLRIARYRFVLEAVEPMSLPPYRGSTLRGGFGHALKRIACRAPGSECATCLKYETCAYGYVFETRPPPDAEVLRTHSAVPRPFVFEVQRKEKTDYQPGEEVEFGLVLIGRGIEYLPHFILGFRALGPKGMGRGRGTFRLKKVWACDPLGPWETLVYDGPTDAVCNSDMSVGMNEIDEFARQLPDERLNVVFKTPTQMKYNGQIVQEPAFHILARNIIRRLSSLYYFHCGERWETDYRGLIQRAKKVEAIDMDLSWQGWRRYSGRQQRSISMGGIIGRVEYKGRLSEFRSIMIIGSLIHAGKKTTCGNGQFAVG